MSATIKHLKRLLILLAMLSLAGCAWLASKESDLIFMPTRDVTSRWGDPPKHEQRFLTIPSTGEQLSAWWVPLPDAAEAATAPTILYLHGSRWNLTGTAFRIRRLQGMGFNVYAIDYRGFGLSGGDKPSEQAAYEDAQVAWEAFKVQVPEPKRRLILGHSLGGAIAIDLATRLKADELKGLVVEASFTSIRDMLAQTQWGWLPVKNIITQEFNSLLKIKQVKLPVLFVHGTADNVVPHTMSDALFAAANEPKQLVKIENGSHSGLSWANPTAYRSALRDLSER
jgi:uncharacterized protein